MHSGSLKKLAGLWSQIAQIDLAVAELPDTVVRNKCYVDG
jgi:hypothetical protein